MLFFEADLGNCLLLTLSFTYCLLTFALSCLLAFTFSYLLTLALSSSLCTLSWSLFTLGNSSLLHFTFSSILLTFSNSLLTFSSKLLTLHSYSLIFSSGSLFFDTFTNWLISVYILPCFLRLFCHEIPNCKICKNCIFFKSLFLSICLYLFWHNPIFPPMLSIFRWEFFILFKGLDWF